MNVLIAAGKRVDVEVPANRMVGDLADELADEHGVAGGAFSLKVDGDVAKRESLMGAISDSANLELVEVTDFEFPDEIAAVAPPEVSAPDDAEDEDDLDEG